MATKFPLHWSLIALASVFMVLTSALVLSNGLDELSILLALRISSLTTALPFLLVFGMRPLQRLRLTAEVGMWAAQHQRDLWVMAAVSHLTHLAQIGLYYRLGLSCPALVWAVTLPLWGIVVGFAAMAIALPQRLMTMQSRRFGFYQLGCWYTWFVFTLAFSLGAATHHLLFYNLPAAVLFVAAAVLRLRPKRLVSAG